MLCGTVYANSLIIKECESYDVSSRFTASSPLKSSPWDRVVERATLNLSALILKYYVKEKSFDYCDLKVHFHVI